MNTFFEHLSLKQKLTILFSFIISFVSLFMSIYVPQRSEAIFIKAIEDKARVIAEMTAYSITPAIVFEDDENIRQNFLNAEQIDELLYIVITKDDTIFTGSNLARAVASNFRTTGVEIDSSIVKVNIDLMHKENLVGTLYLGLSLDNVQKEISESRTAMLTLSLLLFLIGIAAVMLISAYLTNPIKRFVRSIKEISDGNLSRRVDITTEDEIGLLAKSFDEMLDKLQNAYERLDEFNKTLERRVVERTQELKISEERFKSLYNNTPVMLHSMDAQGRILSMNDYWLGNSGYTRDEVVGKPFTEFLTESSRINAETICYPEFMKEGYCRDVELAMQKKNGDCIDILLSAISERDEQKNITRGLAVIIDVTEKKKMIEELIAAKEKAEEMNRVKSNFFANMSHEIRTPLIGILGFSEILTEQLADSPEFAKLASRITLGGRRLLETLNLILNISKLEAGKTEINFAPVNIVKKIKTIYEHYTSVAILNKLEYDFDSSSDEIICSLDEKLLENIAGNIINNALKFTPAGSVAISISTNRTHAIIKVTDTGVGIPKEKQPIIWEEFRQSSEGMGRVYEGTGLGLTIAKRYTEIMKGNISVESEVGKGSTFRLEFPLNKMNL